MCRGYEFDTFRALFAQPENDFFKFRLTCSVSLRKQAYFTVLAVHAAEIATRKEDCSRSVLRRNTGLFIHVKHTFSDIKVSGRFTEPGAFFASFNSAFTRTQVTFTQVIFLLQFYLYWSFSEPVCEIICVSVWKSADLRLLE